MRLFRVARGGAAAVSLLVAGGALSACSHGAARTVATLRASGTVSSGGQLVHGTGPVHVRAGDLVSVESGTAVISLPGDDKVELRKGTSIRLGDGLTLVGGDLLAESGTTPMRITTAIADVVVHGAARLQRDLGLTVGTYAGESTIAAGRTVVLPALTQDSIPSVSVIPTPSPLRLDAADPWDQRLLGNAIELTNQLESQSRYMTANVPATTAATSAFYVRDLQALKSAPVFDDALLHSVTLAGGAPPAGEGLAAAAIALAGPGDFASRWHAVFALRSVGAQWGIVVLQEAANPARVLELIDGAVGSAALAVNTPSIPTAPVTPLTPLTPVVATPPVPKVIAAPPVSSGKAHGHTAQPSASTSPTTTAPPAYTVTTTPNQVLLGPVLSPIVDPLGHLLAGLLGAH